jgi:hypothetical protein
LIYLSAITRDFDSARHSRICCCCNDGDGRRDRYAVEPEINMDTAAPFAVQRWIRDDELGPEAAIAVTD